MSTRRKPQAPNRARAGNVYALFIGAQHGNLTEIAGVYSTQAKAIAAETRIQFPHRYDIVAVPVDQDMFSKLGEMTVLPADEPELVKIEPAPADMPWQFVGGNPVRRWFRQRRENRIFARDKRANAQTLGVWQ